MDQPQPAVNRPTINLLLEIHLILKEKYKQTLQSRVREKCSCEICKGVGFDVMIFRGANRNRRRGFHNVKMFYDHILNPISTELTPIV